MNNLDVHEHTEYDFMTVSIQGPIKLTGGFHITVDVDGPSHTSHSQEVVVFICRAVNKCGYDSRQYKIRAIRKTTP